MIIIRNSLLMSLIAHPDLGKQQLNSISLVRLILLNRSLIDIAGFITRLEDIQLEERRRKGLVVGADVLEAVEGLVADVDAELVVEVLEVFGLLQLLERLHEVDQHPHVSL